MTRRSHRPIASWSAPACDECAHESAHAPLGLCRDRDSSFNFSILINFLASKIQSGSFRLIRMNEQQSDPFATLPPARNSTGFLPLQLDKYPRGELWTSCGPDEEIFGALSFYCDVEDAGKKLVRDLTGFEGKQRDDTYD